MPNTYYPVPGYAFFTYINLFDSPTNPSTEGLLFFKRVKLT